jgi:formate dehydrogenase iron-sulfur subunit
VSEKKMSKAILYDATLCIDCKACEQACAERNKLPYNDAIAAEEVQSAHKYTVVLAKGDKFMRRLCMNCEDPTCASVCPVAAMRKTREGPVIYEEARCMGCRYCMAACPFGVPKYQWDKALPAVCKCDMCSDRVLAGKMTACAEICPTGATKFGERDELVAEAKQRLHDNPGKYVNHIYGLEEVGGTSVLLLSSVPFEEFSYRTDLVREPLPLFTFRVLSRIPDLVGLGGVLLGGIWWITDRRAKVAAAEGKNNEDTKRKA